MEICCLSEFKQQYNKLLKKKSYSSVSSEIYHFFYNKEIEDFRNIGANINNDIKRPFIKKRLKGRGGFRLYYYLYIKNDEVYLAFVHPKTGSLGIENINDDFKIDLMDM